MLYELKQKNYPFLTHIKDIASHYDTFVFDIWGVIHNGEKLFPHVVDCFHQIGSEKIYLLSNSPLRAFLVEHTLEKMGLERSTYKACITSGELCYHILKNRTHPFVEKLEGKFFHLGIDYESNAFDETGFTKTSTLHEANFIITTSPLSVFDTVEDYEETLEKMIPRPMICVNPDHFAKFENTDYLCAGAIAQRYKELGGDVLFIGKPHSLAYDHLKKIITNPQKIIAFGDAFETDMVGSTKAGWDQVLVLTGLYETLKKDGFNEDMYKRLCQDYNVSPTFIISEVMY